MVFGTGSFAGRIVFDIAATAQDPIAVTVAGRNPERLDWLKTAGNARAVIFERPVTFQSRVVDLSNSEGAGANSASPVRSRREAPDRIG